MRMKAILGVLLLLCSLSVAAQQAYVDLERRLTADQLRATGLDTLSASQLDLLNRLLRAESATAKAVEESPREPSRDETVGRSYIGLDDKPISSRLKGSTNGWEPGTVFELENGQQWKVLKGRMALRKTLQSPEILVVPGVAGRWFLQVDADLPKARVYRID